MAKRIASSLLSLALAAASVNAHAYFHTGFVNDVSQGHLFGVRAPQSNSPIQDVASSAITCNSPLKQPVSTDVIEVAPGDKFGMQWNHNFAGPTPGDGDDPIAPSHKGPVIAYMAKVDDASTADGSGLQWFKVAEEGLDTSTGKWGVDTLIANAGRWSFTVPDLVAGQYLLRGEVIALHSASSRGEAQFYMSCVGIKVTGSGTCSPSDTVSFPGAYSASDPGILLSIYGNNGKPVNGGKPYTIPGPAVATCDGSAPAPSSSATSATTSATVSVSTTVTTAKNVASTTSKAVEPTSATSTVASSSSGPASTAASSSAYEHYTTSSLSALPTTLSTVTSSRGPFSNNTKTWESWTWSRPANTNTRSSQTPSVSASGKPTTTTPQTVAPTVTSTRGHGNGNGSGHNGGSGSASSSIAITASATGTGVKIPTGTGSADASSTVKATVPATGTSPASPSGSGYSMTGPGGKKFVCYEVTDS